MNINDIRETLVGKDVLIEGKWEFLEFDSAGTVTQIEELDDLLILHLSNQSKFVGVVNKTRYEDTNTIDFIKSTLDENEIIIFRVRIL